MDSERAQRVMDLYLEASELAPEKHAAFLNENCGADDAIRQEVAALLRCRTGTGDFLAEPVFHVGARLLAEAAEGELRAGDRLGDCVVESLLGIGGMGEVYLARDTVLGRPVAVKLIQRGHGGDLLRRFRHEREVLAGLNHPHIARLYGGAVTPEGRAYLVMEYVEGERLDEYCARRNLNVAARLALFRKVCAAVAYAHRNLVVHRDLKPANVRVTPEGEPKLLDFGIAKWLAGDGSARRADAALTLPGAMTPEYASPEQLRGEAVTTASDVYSLGVILYELLTGQRPHSGETLRPDQLARAVCEDEPPRPSVAIKRQKAEGRRQKAEGPEDTNGVLAPRLAPSAFCLLPSAFCLPSAFGDLDNVVAVALRKDPARRYGSVGQFSEDIRRHCDGLPVSARRDTWAYRSSKFVRRNRAGVAAAALVALALLAGLAAATWQARVARQERDRARVAQRQAERLDDFFQGLLRSADPARMGKDVRVVQVLDAAAATLDRDLAGEPEVLARAHESLAFVYGRLGRVGPSEQHIRTALDLRRRVGGPDDPATIRAELWLAGALWNRQEYREPEGLLRHVLAVRHRQVPPDIYWIARTNEVLGAVLGATDRPQEAEATLRQALAGMRAARGEDDLDYLHLLGTLGECEWQAHRLEAAEADLRRTVRLFDAKTPHGIYALEPQFCLAQCLFDQGRFPESREALARVEADCLQLEGEGGREDAATRGLHACLDFQEGNYAGTIERLQNSAERIAAAFPTGRRVVNRNRALLGLALTRTGQAAAGEPFLRAAYAESGAGDARPSDFNWTFGNPATVLGECLGAQGRFAEAEPLLLIGCERLKKEAGERAPVSIQAAARLRDLYLAWRQSGEINPVSGTELGRNGRPESSDAGD